jgi:hypothetical protein
MDGRIQRRPGRRGLSAFQTLTPTSPPPERYLLLSTEKPAQRVVALFAEIHWLRLVAGKYHRACATRTFRTLDCNWRNVGVIRLGFRHDPSPSKPVIGNQPFPALRVDNCSCVTMMMLPDLRFAETILPVVAHDLRCFLRYRRGRRRCYCN